MKNHLLAREIVEDSAVLLKNEAQLLPLAQHTSLAVFGRTQTSPVLGGNGSGAVEADVIDLIACLRTQGLNPVSCLEAFYRSLPLENTADDPDWSNMAQIARLVHNGLIYEYFGHYRPTPAEPHVPETLLMQAARETDTALFLLGRTSGGEECDRHLANDYYLSDAEKSVLNAVCAHFANVILVLNVNGQVDLHWLDDYPTIRSVLFLGVPGEAGMEALARLLAGNAFPSGKLSFSIARSIEDYPCAYDFSWDKENPDAIKTYADYGLDAEANGSQGYAKSPVTVYREGLYNGYRHFDNFGKEPLFPFGFGLTYTSFQYGDMLLSKEEDGLRMSVPITNVGMHTGQEVVQFYLRPDKQELEQPVQRLIGFAKSKKMAVGETVQVSCFVPWAHLSCYDDTSAAWIIEKGICEIHFGASSRETTQGAVLLISECIVLQQCANRLQLSACNRRKLDFLHREAATGAPSRIKHTLLLSASDIPQAKVSLPTNDVDVSGLSELELAALCVGYGTGVPFSAFVDCDLPNTIQNEQGCPLTVNDHPTGRLGYVSPAMPERGIHSIAYSDGPAGIGQTAWPSEMLLACSFDEELCRRFGDGVGAECEQAGMDVWLAPAVNLHRHPLCGRNFEYFSEDPLLTGILAVSVVKGVQENHPVLVCAKHFAANEQETYRRGSAKLNYDAADSIMPERVMRELYLRPFEMMVREGGIHCVMTSFNKINGCFTAASRDLCTHILREEWGFDGVVVTDWGDMDTVVNGADAVHAGNDVIMPGGPPVIQQILTGLQEGRVTRQEIETAVCRLISVVHRVRP